MTDLDLAELERLARGATPGPWSWHAKQTVDGDSWAVFDSHDHALAMNTDGWVLDAEFIAATGPDTVLALVARLREAEARIEKVTAERDALSSLREQMSLRLRYVEGKREQAEAERDRLDEAFDRDLPWRYDEVEAQRNQLAAVVEQVREGFDSLHWGCNNPDHECGYRKQADALMEAPSVALDRVKAEALREAADYLDSFEGPGGRQSAHDRAGRDTIRLIRDRADRIETEGDR